MHAAVKAMRAWWSAAARQEYTEVAQEMGAAGIDEATAMRWLARLYDAAARDEAEGGDGVRIEAISLRRIDLQSISGHTDDGVAILESTPTIELRVRRAGAWKALFSRPLATISEGKVAQLWDADGLNV